MSVNENEGFGLNEQQKAAVAIQDGPALIVAGAGTGKTRVLVDRVTCLLAEGVHPRNILALTFTEKAATEMQDRVNQTTATYQTELSLMTFNAFGESILREFASDIGLSRNFRVMSEDAQIVFLRERIDQLELEYFSPISGPDSQLGNLRQYFSKLKQQVITPDDYADFVRSMPATDDAEQLEKIKHMELSKAYKIYITLCRQAGMIDYDDQIYTVLDLLKQRPNVARELQNRYQYILVDEFQDTNTMQSVLVDLLVGETKNLFVVGDDDQSIYEWRGATLANILDFKTRYPHAKEVTLTENYRSTQEILDAAYRIIVNNNPHRLEAQLKINKQLHAQASGEAPRVEHFEKIEQELAWVADDISKKIEKGTAPEDIAVLARSNDMVSRLAEQLQYKEVPHVVIGQRFDLFKEPIVRSLLEAMKVLVEESNNALYHTLTGPLFEIPVADVAGSASAARREHHSLYTILAEHGSPHVLTALEKLTAWRELSSTMSVSHLAYHMFEDSGLKDRLIASEASDTNIAKTISRLSDFLNSLRDFERVAVQPSVTQYVDALPALMAADGTSEDDTLDLSSSMVNLLSIHKSKGLEWNHVYIINCCEGSFPSVRRSSGIQLPDGLQQVSSEADEHLAEERRLMYVAMTRAKEQLVLSYSDSNGGSRTRKPSRFLEEAFGTTDFPYAVDVPAFTIASLGNFDSLIDDAIPIPSSILLNEQVTLSVTKVVNYQKCPLDFYYRYVLRMPSEPTPSTGYGTLMHSLLEDMNRCVFDGRPLTPLSELEQRLETEWPQLGYLSAAQRDRAYAKAQATLKRLHQVITENPRQPLAIETPFKVHIPDSKLTIEGRLDAVFPLGDSVEIVDYKTSSGVDTPEKAKQRASASEQLTLYALAWQDMHDELPAQVTLDFVESGQRGPLKKTQRGINGAYQRLAKVADGIRNHDFAPARNIDHKHCIHPALD